MLETVEGNLRFLSVVKYNILKCHHYLHIEVQQPVIKISTRNKMNIR